MNILCFFLSLAPYEDPGAPAWISDAATVGVVFISVTFFWLLET